MGTVCGKMIVLGSLTIGCFLADAGAVTCRRGSPHTAKFRLGSAEFTFQVCTFQAVGHTSGYDIQEISVKDNNLRLPTETRGQIIKRSSSQLREAIQRGQFAYTQNHHNACDSFYLEVSELKARYALTTAPLAGCGAIVEHAPKRSWEDQSELTLYVVDYGQGFGEPQSVPFGHWLIAND